MILTERLVFEADVDELSAEPASPKSVSGGPFSVVVLQQLV